MSVTMIPKGRCARCGSLRWVDRPVCLACHEELLVRQARRRRVWLVGALALTVLPWAIALWEVLGG